MTLVQLKHLIELANSGSFSQSALKLHLTQPALSRSIKALEDELGQALLAFDADDGIGWHQQTHVAGRSRKAHLHQHAGHEPPTRVGQFHARGLTAVRGGRGGCGSGRDGAGHGIGRGWRETFRIVPSRGRPLFVAASSGQQIQALVRFLALLELT
mgnify:CR=1 FL=1